MTYAVEPVAAVDHARRQHAALYVDTIEVFQPMPGTNTTRYRPRDPALVTRGEYAALVQADRNLTAVVTSGPDDNLVGGIVVKTGLSTPIAPGWWVVVRACDHTPGMVGRWFRVGADDLQSLAVTLRFRATASTPAGVRPPEPTSAP